MSEQDVEIVRRIVAELNAGISQGNPAAPFDSGIAGAEFTWNLPANAPAIRSVYEGREGWLEFMKTWTEDFEWSIEIEEAIDVGDGRVIVNTRQRAVGKSSGVPVEAFMGTIFTVKGGQVVRGENFLDPAEALEAAGLSD
jgi:ketosteroid isomerase-like protein